MATLIFFESTNRLLQAVTKPMTANDVMRQWVPTSQIEWPYTPRPAPTFGPTRRGTKRVRKDPPALDATIIAPSHHHQVATIEDQIRVGGRADWHKQRPGNTQIDTTYLHLVLFQRNGDKDHFMEPGALLGPGQYFIAWRHIYVAYMRLSTHKQKAEYGFVTQRREIEAWVAARNGLIQEYVEEVWSATFWKRRLFQNALETCMTHRRIIVAARTDRMFRNADHVAYMNLHHIAFEIVELGQEQSRLILGVCTAVAEEEARMISTRTKHALQELRGGQASRSVRENIHLLRVRQRRILDAFVDTQKTVTLDDLIAYTLTLPVTTKLSRITKHFCRVYLEENQLSLFYARASAPNALCPSLASDLSVWPLTPIGHELVSTAMPWALDLHREACFLHTGNRLRILEAEDAPQQMTSHKELLLNLARYLPHSIKI